MYLRVGQAFFGALLVGDNEEERTDPHAAVGTGDEQRGGLHLGRNAAHAQPGLPFVEQLVGDRVLFGLMLAVEGILALDHAGVVGHADILGCIDQRIGHAEIGHSGVLNGGVLAAGALHADGTGGNNDIAAADFLLHAAAGAHADEGIGTAVGQLFQRNGSGRAADAGAGNADGHAVEGAGVGNKLAAVRHKAGVIKIFGNFGAALGVAGQKHIAAHIAGPQPDMILLAAAFGIINHRFQPPEWIFAYIIQRLGEGCNQRK